MPSPDVADMLEPVINQAQLRVAHGSKDTSAAVVSTNNDMSNLYNSASLHPPSAHFLSTSTAHKKKKSFSKLRREKEEIVLPPGPRLHIAGHSNYSSHSQAGHWQYSDEQTHPLVADLAHSSRAPCCRCSRSTGSVGVGCLLMTETMLVEQQICAEPRTGCAEEVCGSCLERKTGVCCPSFFVFSSSLLLFQ